MCCNHHDAIQLGLGAKNERIRFFFLAQVKAALHSLFGWEAEYLAYGKELRNIVGGTGYRIWKEPLF